MKANKLKIACVFFSLVFGTIFTLFNLSFAQAAAVPVTGKAKVLNTDNSYLDFTNYSSNVTVDDSSGNFSGYAFLEDMGWVAFGTTDNSLGPINVNLVSGAVTGKAKVLNTDNSYLDFTNYNSNVTANITTGVFSGYVFSEDMGWINFSDTGVSTSSTLDVVAPLPFDLDSPGGNVYINEERPTFRWKTTTDATSGLSKYKLEADNGDSGDFVLDDIPVSRTTDYETSKYIAKYFGFSDSDDNNNYITVQAKSTSDWGNDDNDGKLKEGKRIWAVKAVDTVSNERTSSRTLFVDRTGPSIEITQVNQTAFSDNLATIDTTPTISGKITDSLVGDKTDNKVASGPKEVEIKFEKRNYLGLYSLHSLTTVNINKLYWSDTGAEITDNSKSTSNKYSNFSYTPTTDLPLGTYRITLTGKDKADSNGDAFSFNLTIKTFEEIAEKLEIPEEEVEEIIREQKIVIPEELKKPSKIAEGIGKIAGGVINLWWKTVDTGKFIATKIGEVLAFAIERTGQGLAFAGRTTERYLALRKQKIKEQRTARAEAYLNLAQKAPEEIKEGLLALARGKDAVDKAVGNAVNKTAGGINTFASKLVNAWQTSRESVSKPASEEAQALTTRLKIATSTFVAIVFDKEPTRIFDIRVEETTPTSASIVWYTNHYATSKVNYGFSTQYGKEVYSNKRVKEHRMVLKDLEPGKFYYFEVMSQNKNYVYDAYYTFKTPEKEGEKIKGAAAGKILATITADEGNWVLVREEPSLKSNVLAKVATGESYLLLEEKDGWVKIKIDGQEGWVFGELVKIGDEKE